MQKMDKSEIKETDIIDKTSNRMKNRKNIEEKEGMERERRQIDEEANQRKG